MKKIKVVLSGIFYPLAMLTYFRRALERRDDVELFTVGPYTDDFIPWNGGMRVPKRYVKAPDFALPSTLINNPIPFALVKNMLPWKPDLWLQVDAGWHFSDRPESTIVVHIQTDPHVLKEFYRQIKQQNDIVFCMQNEYRDMGEYYLPYAFDPTLFYPENKEKIYDACLIGLHYEQRDQLVSSLRQHGFNVYYNIGEIFDEFRERYNQSRIALNWSSLKDLNARTFEAFGMALPLVTNRVPDLGFFFVEGDHYLGFNDVNEAIEKVAFLLKNPQAADEMAYSAYRKVIAGHTWDHRINQIFELCKLS